MSYENLIIEISDRIQTVTINRPEKLNALNLATLAELRQVFTEAAASSEVDVLVLTGAGDKAFVAGADISELARLDVLGGRQYALDGQAVLDAIEKCPKPVIAAVNGYALGGGCEIALACHIRIASENAVFGQPEVKLGLIPGFGGTQRLGRLVGKGRAAEIIFTGANVKADEAFRIGLVNKVCPAGESVIEALAMAKTIAAQGQVAVRYAVQGVNAIHETSLEQGLVIEASYFGLCCGSEDFKEGTSAFLEKHKPNFTGK